MSNRFQIVSAIFRECVDLDADTRARRLAALDPDVRAEVEALLAADERSSFGLTGGVGASLGRIAEDQPPEGIRGYTLLRRLGAGGMGIVYEAEQERPRRRVALKTLLPWLQHQEPQVWFANEAQAMAGLVHPAIPQVYEVFEHEGRPFIAMELVDGVTLDVWAYAHDTRAVVAAIGQVASAVAYAHARGVVHGDVKPGNVLVSTDDRPKLLDFGLARLRDAAPAPVAAGTPAYMAPEQRTGPPGPPADVWALGAVLYAMVEKRLPATPRGPMADEGLERVVSRAMSTRPEDRQDATAFADDLARWAAGRPVQARPIDLGYRARTAWRRRRAWVIGAGLAALGLAAAAGATRAVDAWRAREAARLAEARWDVARAPLLARVADDGDGAIRETAAFLDTSGDGAAALAWGELADAFDAARDRPRALSTRARAWLASSGPEQRRALAAALAATSRWGGVVGLLDAERDLAPEEQALFDTARAALRLGAAPIPALWRGTETAWGPALEWMPGDERAAPMLFTRDGAVVQVAPSPTLPAVATYRPDVPLPAGFSRLWDGGTVLYSDASYDRIGLWRLEGPALRPLGVWDVSRQMCAAAGPDHVIYVGTGPYTRVVRALHPDGRVTVVSAAVDRVRSDVLAMVAEDLDGDGRAELAIAHGPWRGFEVRLLRPDAPTEGERFLGSAAIGSPKRMVAATLGGGRRLVVLHHGQGLNRAPRPDAEHHLTVLRVAGDTLVAEHDVTLPDAEWEYLFAADIDADGLDELLVSARSDRVQTVVATGPDLTPHVLAGVFAVGAVQADADGADEIVAQVDGRRFWVLGAGDTPLPAAPLAPAPPDPDPLDPALAAPWRRARALVRVGLDEEAGPQLERLARVAVDPRDRDALAAEARAAAARLGPQTADALGVSPDAVAHPLVVAGDPGVGDLAIVAPEWGRWERDGLHTDVFDIVVPVGLADLAAPDAVIEVTADVSAKLGLGAAWRLWISAGDDAVGVGMHPSGGDAVFDHFLATFTPSASDPFAHEAINGVEGRARVIVDRVGRRARFTWWGAGQDRPEYDVVAPLPPGFGDGPLQVGLGGGLTDQWDRATPHGEAVWRRVVVRGATPRPAPTPPPSPVQRALRADAAGDPAAATALRALPEDAPELAMLLVAHEERAVQLVLDAFGRDVLYARYADAWMPDGAAPGARYLITPLFDGLIDRLGPERRALTNLAGARVDRLAVAGDTVRACAEADAITARVEAFDPESAAAIQLVCYEVASDPAARARHREAYRRLAPSLSYADRVLAQLEP